jgi:Tfp pilus assembly protein FimT
MIEMLVVLVVASLIMLIALRPLNRSRQVTNARSARVEAAMGLALARSAGVARGCNSVFHLTRGSVGQMWVTSCKSTTIGSAGTIVDTLGRIDSLNKRFGVTVSGTADSVQYDSRGLSVGFATAAFAFQSATGIRDTLSITALGRVAQ